MKPNWSRKWLAGWVAGLAMLPGAGAGIDIQFDYRYDARGFFSGANFGRRQVLEAAAAVFEKRINSTPPRILPSGINTWTLSFPNPNNGATVTLTDLVIPTGVVKVFVGASSLKNGFIAYTEYNYTYYGDASWVRLFRAKDDANGFSPFGGSISFEVSAPWFFASNPDQPENFPDRYDFYSLALHELGHILGFNSGARAFEARTEGEYFFGTHADELYGGPVPLAPDLGHWLDDVMFGGTEASMTPYFDFDQRKPFTELDFAALQDLGYEVRPRPPEPLEIIGIEFGNEQLTVRWRGGVAPYRLQIRESLLDTDWSNAGAPTEEPSLRVPSDLVAGFFRVVDSTP